MQYSRFRSAASVRHALVALIALFSVAGYVVISGTIRSDREAAAGRRAEIESVRTQALLDRARAYVVGLGNVLADERVAQPRRFAELVGSTAGSAGLVDALWVQNIPGSARGAYERRIHAPITRLTGSDTFAVAPPEQSYLAATFTTRTRVGMRAGVDVSTWPALASAIRDQATVFAVSASNAASLGNEPGFYLLESGRFGRGSGSGGYLAVFVPRGWLTLYLEDDPRQVAILLDGRTLEGQLHSSQVASTRFEALARSWRVEVATGSPSGLQSLLPWFALAWPVIAAVLAFLVGNAVVGRRRAEREVERIFDFSLDMLGIAGLDGYFKQVNPAFERTLGYSREQLLSQPFFNFIHPEDVARSREALEALGRGQEVVHFENRYICSDGTVSWLEWNVRPAPKEGLVYAAARDVTERRRAEEEARDAQQMVEMSRDELRVLADEQAALRRVATLVAQGVPPGQVFDTVTAEMGGLLGADRAALVRYEPDGTGVIVATSTEPGIDVEVGMRLTLEGESVAARVRRSGRAERMDTYEGAHGSDAAMLRELGLRSAAGAPIVVEGRLWGVMVAGWRHQRNVSVDTEARISQFTELVATAIANAETRAELAASRRRVVAAGDETRRQIERDLHDGTQQRLVSIALALRAAEAKIPPELGEVRAEVFDAAMGLAAALEALQEISRGIHPAILSKGGLEVALKGLARRAGVPVELDVRSPRRLPPPVEVAAYYVVSEALTNAAKHAGASVVKVELIAADSIVELAVEDDGVGGADPGRGSGLIGLRDRVETLGGTIEIASRRGHGTSIVVTIPIHG